MHDARMRPNDGPAHAADQMPDLARQCTRNIAIRPGREDPGRQEWPDPGCDGLNARSTPGACTLRGGRCDNGARLPGTEHSARSGTGDVARMERLRLEVRDFESPVRWRWLLTREGSGAPLADHQVNLSGASWEFGAFEDMYQYLRWNAVPDRRADSEAVIAAQVGEWAGRTVLGEAVGQVIVAAAPVTVRVFPGRAGFLLGWPLELAHAGGRPLAARGDVTLAYELGIRHSLADRARLADPSSDGAGLRMLAVFSLPTESSVLALRRERYELTRLIRRIAGRQRRHVRLSVVQYGATRDRLAAIAESGDGWDLLHLSGHGGRGLFLLEEPDGSPDPVDTDDLVGLLAPLRNRVRLAVVSACESAAATTAETMRWVGLGEQAEELEQQTGLGRDGVASEPVATGIARALEEQLGCPVVAMRYPVADEFAVSFAAELYERLLGSREEVRGGRGQPLAVALARAVRAAAGPTPSAACPVLSVVTPVLIAGSGPGPELILDVPLQDPVLDVGPGRMERFPAEPERFVGRTAIMAKAGTALAPASGQTGVLLYGMAGSGKTACAAELAWRHEHAFGIAAFWQAPRTDDQFAGGLASLAAALEVQLRDFGFAMSDKIATSESIAAFAPRMRRMLEENGVLLVMDNLETLLTNSGQWRDPRWAPLIAALTSHDGESRVILTSRVQPTGLGHTVARLAVHALSLAESAALARELPGLRGLLHADAGPVRDPGEQAVVAADRELVRRVLRVVQGHPKLMELADAAATDPAQLAAGLDAAETAAGGGEGALDAFFRNGVSGLEAVQFLDALTTWTTTALSGLGHPAALMAQFLACLEETDRETSIVKLRWADLWRDLEQPGEPPVLGPLLAALSNAALVRAEPMQEDRNGRASVESALEMHPGIADAIRATTPQAVRDAADISLAAYWIAFAETAKDWEGGEAGHAVVRAGLAAAPYLLRLREWGTAGGLIEDALMQDNSPGTIQAALPVMRAIVSAAPDPDYITVLARIIADTDPAEAEQLLRHALDQLVMSENYGLARVTAGDLANLLISRGRLAEALDLADQNETYAQQAGVGPWSVLNIQAHKLQILGMMGNHQQVLDQLVALRAQLDVLPAPRDNDEGVEPWYVRELILSTGDSAAGATGQRELELELLAALVASMQARRATDHEIARARLNQATPLIRLGRLDEAEQVLAECQEIFEEHNDIARLANVLAVRADLGDERGNQQSAIALERTTIRYKYIHEDVRGIAISHHSLATYMKSGGIDPAEQRAHRLAATLIFQLVGMTHEFTAGIERLAGEILSSSQGGDSLPATVTEVIEVTERTEGVRLGQLVTALQPDTNAVANALAQILDNAVSHISYISNSDPVIAKHLSQFDSDINLAIDAALGERKARARLARFLTRLAGSEEGHALAVVLAKIAMGERSASLLDRLSGVDAGIAAEVLTRLAQPPPSTGRGRN
jgi:tetratricopeptide (TPR) repeat protein